MACRGGNSRGRVGEIVMRGKVWNVVGGEVQVVRGEVGPEHLAMGGEVAELGAG